MATDYRSNRQRNVSDSDILEGMDRAGSLYGLNGNDASENDQENRDDDAHNSGDANNRHDMHAGRDAAEDHAVRAQRTGGHDEHSSYAEDINFSLAADTGNNIFKNVIAEARIHAGSDDGPRFHDPSSEVGEDTAGHMPNAVVERDPLRADAVGENPGDEDEHLQGAADGEVPELETGKDHFSSAAVSDFLPGDARAYRPLEEIDAGRHSVATHKQHNNSFPQHSQNHSQNHSLEERQKQPVAEKVSEVDKADLDGSLDDAGDSGLLPGASSNHFLSTAADDDILLGDSGVSTWHMHQHGFNWYHTGAHHFRGGHGNHHVKNKHETGFDDYLEGGVGNDLLMGGIGDDTLLGGADDDILFGDGGAGRYNLDLQHSGGHYSQAWHGARFVSRGHGVSFDDYLDGGAGNDRLYAQQGNDTANYSLVENLAEDFSDIGTRDVYDGGRGTDTLRLTLTHGEAALSSVQQDIIDYQAFLASNANSFTDHGATFTFSSFGLAVTDFEKLDVKLSNSGPTANADEATADENQRIAIDVVANDTDTDHLDELTLNNVSIAAVTGLGKATAGSVSIVNNQLVFDPGMDFDALGEGDSATVVVAYTINDLSGEVSSSTLTISVNGSNDGPVIVLADTVASGTVLEDAPSDTVGGRVLAADVDLGDNLNYSVTGSGTGSYGSLVIDALTGEWLYTLDNGKQSLQELDTGNSVIDSFTVEVSDGHGGIVTQQVDISIDGNTDNTPPLAEADKLVVVSQGNVTTTLNIQAPVDAEGDILAVTVNSLPDNGLVRLADDSVLTNGQILSVSQLTGLSFSAYPDAGQGNSVFSYTVTDGAGAADTVDINIQLLAGETHSRGAVQVLCFDDVPTYHYDILHDGYGGFNWYSSHSPYQSEWSSPVIGAYDDYGWISPSQVATNILAGKYSYIDWQGEGSFNFEGAWFKNAGDAYELILYGYNDGVLIGSEVVDITTSWQYFNSDLDGIDQLVIEVSSGARSGLDITNTGFWAMDDFLFTTNDKTAIDLTLDGIAGNDVLLGAAGADSISGFGGDDRIDGGAGNDWLTGGDGNDLFVFADGSGNDTITDFQAGADSDDVIDLSDFGFVDLASVLAVSEQLADGVIIQLDSDDSLSLQNVELANLNQDDFLF